MRKLSLSVLMPCLNPSENLDESISSCLKNVELDELVIADGMSGVETIEKLKNWSKKDKRIKWFSRKDLNIADALNHALEISSGDLIGWLNTDDLYAEGSLKRSIDYLSKNIDKDMVFGIGEHINEKGEFIDYYPTKYKDISHLSFQEGCFICQPTVIFRRELIDEIGGFDINWKYTFDMELWLRIFFFKKFNNVGFINKVQAYTRLHKDTITSNNQAIINIECALLIEKYIGQPYDHWLKTAACSYYEEYHENALKSLDEFCKNLKLSDYLKDKFANFVRIISNQFYIEKNFTDLIEDMPIDFVLILFSRVDLINSFINIKINKNKYAEWLFTYGKLEYNSLFELNISNKKILYDWINKYFQKDKNYFIKKLSKISFKRISKVISIDKFLIKTRNYFRSNFFKKYSLIQDKIEDQRLNQNPKIKNNKLKGTILIVIGENFSKAFYSNFIKLIESINKNSSIFISKCGSCYNYKTNEDININKQDYDISIFLMEINDIITYIYKQDVVNSSLGYKIAYLDWDLKNVPTYYNFFIDLVDEIWTTNSIAYSAIKKISEKINLFNFPPFFTSIGITQNNIRTSNEINSSEINLSNKGKDFIFYSEVDLNESYNRNNLKGALSSFINAFPLENKSEIFKNVYFQIIVKGKEFNKNEYQYLIDNYSLNPRIKIIESHLFSKLDKARLNCLVSLHRSCGFNFQILQAFDLNQSIIHTSWGGHLDYCYGINCYPVNYSLLPISPKNYKFWPGQVWAEPNLNEAKNIMKKIVDEFKNKRNNRIVFRNSSNMKDQFFSQLTNRLKLVFKLNL